MISGPPFPAGALLTSRPCRSTLVGMDSEENLPLRRDDTLTMMARQDLDPLSVAELDSRIAALETEIGRIRRHPAKDVNHRASAPAFFRRGARTATRMAERSGGKECGTK